MAMQGKPTDPQSSAESDERIIVDRIFNAVLEQRLAPKTKLNEADLCETFNVGRMKVRRALLLLSNQGIVDLHSNRGAYVASPEPEDAEEVFAARLHIEPGIVEEITRTVGPDGLSMLHEHLDMEKEARAGGNQPEIIRLSGEFHIKLAIVSGNRLLTRILRELVTRTSLILSLFGSGQGSSCREDEHEQILHAISNGDAPTARRLVIDHLNHIQEGLVLASPPQTPQSVVNILQSSG